MDVILDLMTGETVSIRLLGHMTGTMGLLNDIQAGKMLVYRPDSSSQGVSGYAYLNSRHILRVHPAEESY